MQIGMIGLEKMGINMARRLLRGGHEIFAYNRTPGDLSKRKLIPALYRLHKCRLLHPGVALHE